MRLRAAAACALAAALGSDAGAREVWRSGERVLLFSGSIREVLETTDGTDADEFLDAARAAGAVCVAPPTFPSCPAFATVGQRDVWESLTRLRLSLAARASKRWSAELVYDNEWRAGILDTLGDALAQPSDDFLDLEGDILDPDADHFRWRHRIYRGWLRYEGDHLHATVGRQRLAWGVGRLWNPIDRLSAVGPLAIEGDEFAGIDAIEAHWMFTGSDYLQAVYAPGGSSDEARYALRFHGVVRNTDVSLLAGVFEEALAVGGDLAANLGGAAWRVEAIYTDPEQEIWPVGEAAPREPETFWQAVFSIDYTLNLGNGVYLLAEHLYDGNALGFGRGEAGTLLPFFETSGSPLTGPVVPASPALFGGSRVVSLAKHTTGFQIGTDLSSALRGDFLVLFDWDGTSAAFVPMLAYAGWNAIELHAGVQLFTGPHDSQYGPQQATLFAIVEWFF